MTKPQKPKPRPRPSDTPPARAARNARFAAAAADRIPPVSLDADDAAALAAVRSATGATKADVVRRGIRRLARDLK